MRMKYVVFEEMYGIIIPPGMQHSAAKKLMPHLEVTSAGEIFINDSREIVCVGRSFSLGVESRPKDSHLFRYLVSPY